MSSEGEPRTVPIQEHVKRFLADHELMIFSVTVASMCVFSYLLVVHLPALIVGILLAYLMDALIQRLCAWGCPRMFAIFGSLIIALAGIALLLLIGVPKLAEQTVRFSRQLPETIGILEGKLSGLAGRLPEWAPDSWSDDGLFAELGEQFTALANSLLSATVTNASGAFFLLVYMILIPLMVFFLLRDKQAIIAWINKFIPSSPMIESLKSELDEQFGAYVRGKIIEGLVIFSLSFLCFVVLGVNYSFALAVGIGLSVIIPFVGAVVVTIPVVIVGLLQFGFGSEFWWMIGLYCAVQVFDAQILVPLLFSEVVKIHPVAILVSILLFGSIWGIWGVFFAIPLASLVKSVITVVEKQLSGST